MYFLFLSKTLFHEGLHYLLVFNTFLREITFYYINKIPISGYARLDKILGCEKVKE